MANENITQRTQLEQGRAAFAYQRAEDAKKTLNKAKEYKSYVKKLPMLIKTNGLGASIAFAYAKGAKNGKVETTNPWGLLYTHIEDWLLFDEKKLLNFEKGSLARELTKTDSAIYRSVTVEVLAFLTWLRRFAEALIEGEATDTK